MLLFSRVFFGFAPKKGSIEDRGLGLSVKPHICRESRENYHMHDPAPLSLYNRHTTTSSYILHHKPVVRHTTPPSSAERLKKNNKSCDNFVGSSRAGGYSICLPHIHQDDLPYSTGDPSLGTVVTKATAGMGDHGSKGPLKVSLTCLGCSNKLFWPISTPCDLANQKHRKRVEIHH